MTTEKTNTDLDARMADIDARMAEIQRYEVEAIFHALDERAASVMIDEGTLTFAIPREKGALKIEMPFDAGMQLLRDWLNSETT